MCSTSVRWWRQAAILAGAMLSCEALSGQACAARPPAARLLPQNTAAYLSVADTRDFRDRFSRTALGQMSGDPQMKPLVDQLHGSVATAFASIEDRVGLSLDELLAIPQGELAVGVVASETDRPALVVLLDSGDQTVALQKLIERGAAALEQGGGARREEEIGDTKLAVYTLPGPAGREVVYFQKEGTLVLATNLAVAQSLLGVWNGGDGATLAENQHFAAIVQRSRGARGEEPQVTWFVNPIALVRSAAGDNAGARVGLAVLPTLGLDGLLGVGGTVILATEQFDALAHMHVLLDSPRAGVIELLALASGETTPERWVPAEAASYTTAHWNVDQTYRKLAVLVDSFQGKGAFDRQVQQRVTDFTGVNVEQEILPALAGRFSYATWIERPATLFSQGTLLGVRLNDAAQFEAAVDKLVARFKANLERKTYGGKTYYQYVVPPGSQPAGDPRRPCFGLLGDYLLVADRESFYQKAIITESDPSQSLAESLDYKLIASKISRQPGGDKPGLVAFNRPEEGMRFLYDLAASDETRERLRTGAQRSEFLRNVEQALEDNPLPPFAVLQQYLAPGGAILSDDETGFHYLSFTLARKQQ